MHCLHTIYCIELILVVEQIFHHVTAARDFLFQIHHIRHTIFAILS